jgi:hypothetical protein
MERDPDLIECESCGRRNAPRRMSCLYCGAKLVIPVERVARRPRLRRLEEWERGFNIGLLPQMLDREKLADLAEWLGDAEGGIARILQSNRGLPFIRLSTSEERDLVCAKLKSLGLRFISLADDELLREPSRLRSLRFADVVCAGQDIVGRSFIIGWDSIRLIVKGRLYVRRIESVESKKGRREREVIDERELIFDHPALDLYDRTGRSWRIVASSFDFRCLGERMLLTAEGNFHLLSEAIRERASCAVYDDYDSVRRLLDDVWPPAEQKASIGWRRGGFLRINTASTTLLTNEAQLTRYGRWRYLLLEKEGGPLNSS